MSEEILSRLERIDHKEYSCGFEFADSSTFDEMARCFEERKILAKEIERLTELCNKYEEEHKTTFETWQKDIKEIERLQQCIKDDKENADEIISEQAKEIERLNNQLEEKEAILGGIQQLEAEIERLNNKIKRIAYQCYKSDMSYDEFKQIWVNAMGKIYEPSQIDELEKDYYEGTGYDYEYLLKNISINNLNDEVEVIEDKKIEKIYAWYEYNGIDDKELTKIMLDELKDKINEIIDYLNKEE